MVTKNLTDLELSAPWTKFYREMEALFKDDPEIDIEYDPKNYEIKLVVEDNEKADALTQLLPVQKVFGKIVMKITVVPANANTSSKTSLFQRAFKGNPALSYVKHSEKALYSFDYVVFKNKVVQFFNDDLTDINGNCSTLYQELAKDIFGEQIGIFFCTDVEESATKK